MLLSDVRKLSRAGCCCCVWAQNFFILVSLRGRHDLLPFHLAGGISLFFFERERPRERRERLRFDFFRYLSFFVRDETMAKANKKKSQTLGLTRRVVTLYRTFYTNQKWLLSLPRYAFILAGCKSVVVSCARRSRASVFGSNF